MVLSIYQHLVPGCPQDSFFVKIYGRTEKLFPAESGDDGEVLKHEETEQA